MRVNPNSPTCRSVPRPVWFAWARSSSATTGCSTSPSMGRLPPAGRRDRGDLSGSPAVLRPTLESSALCPGDYAASHRHSPPMNRSREPLSTRPGYRSHVREYTLYTRNTSFGTSSRRSRGAFGDPTGRHNCSAACRSIRRAQRRFRPCRRPLSQPRGMRPSRRRTAGRRVPRRRPRAVVDNEFLLFATRPTTSMGLRARRSVRPVGGQRLAASGHFLFTVLVG